MQLLENAKMTDELSRDLSFHPEPNALFNLPGYDPCRNPSCRMHATDQGLFKKIMDMVIQQVKLESATIRTAFENRCDTVVLPQFIFWCPFSYINTFYDL
jgi:hypothetical protein